MKTEEQVASELAQFARKVTAECDRRGGFADAMPLLIVERYWAWVADGRPLPEPASLAEGMLLTALPMHDVDPWFITAVGSGALAHHRRGLDRLRSHEMDTWHESQRWRVVTTRVSLVSRLL